VPKDGDGRNRVDVGIDNAAPEAGLDAQDIEVVAGDRRGEDRQGRGLSRLAG
jgi:hypothetical protein